MKKLFFILSVNFLALFGLFQTACNTKNVILDPQEYFDSIVHQTTIQVNAHNFLMDRLDEEKPDFHITEKALNDYKSYTEKAIHCITILGPYEENNTYRAATLEYLTLDLKIINNDYKQFLEILKKNNGDFSEADAEKWDKMMDKINEKEEKVEEIYYQAEEAFAKKYDFELEKPIIKHHRSF